MMLFRESTLRRKSSLAEHLSPRRPPPRTRFESAGALPRKPHGKSFLTRDGAPLLLRPIEIDDAEALIRAFGRMTPEQIRLRVFHTLTELPMPIARYLCKADPEKVAAFVVTDPDGIEIRGEARVYFDPVTEQAEFAIALDPAFVGRGVGHALMSQLIASCREHGMRSVWGDVLSENVAMIDLGERLGFTRQVVPGDPGLLRLTLALD